jgi:hypothetical protein
MRYSTRRWLILAIPLLCATTLSCRNARNTRPYRDPPPADITPTVIEYIETDAFDTLFESALTNQDAVIVIQTGTSQPDWGPRLNAWIAAWNRGGKVVDTPQSRVRMQAPLPVPVNGETVRELRLLIDDLMTHLEDAARVGSSWWTEERTQRRRVALLKPYSLRFHLDEDKNIQLIFFNGMYSRYYRQFMDSIATQDTDEAEEWSRDMKCSSCKKKVLGTTAQRTRVRSGSPQ